MEERGGGLAEAEQTAETSTVPAKKTRSTWLRVPLYLLAVVGALFIAAAIYAVNKKAKEPERVLIDEAGTIDSVMTDNYGKYSEVKRGWLYVDEDNRTYLMRVIQQVKLPDNPAGEEMYFLASGAAVDGEPGAVLGAFYVHPDPDKPGTLVATSLASMPGGSSAVRPEDVHFEALSEALWGWIVKVKDGRNPKEEVVSVNNVVLAPHDNTIVELAQFPAAREYDLGTECLRAHQSQNPAPAKEAPAATPAPTGDAKVITDDEPAAAAAAAPAPAAEEADSAEETEPEVFDLCQKRRWTYRIGTVNGSIPVPISVTVSGTYDSQPVQAKTWKLMFDSKVFRYNVPDDIGE